MVRNHVENQSFEEIIVELELKIVNWVHVEALFKRKNIFIIHKQLNFEAKFNEL